MQNISQRHNRVRKSFYFRIEANKKYEAPLVQLEYDSSLCNLVFIVATTSSEKKGFYNLSFLVNNGTLRQKR